MHLARQASERSRQARFFFMAGTPAKTAAYPACAPSASARYRKLGKSLRKRISLRRCPTSHSGVAACRRRPEQLELLLGGLPGRLAGARFLAISGIASYAEFGIAGIQLSISRRRLTAPMAKGRRQPLRCPAGHAARRAGGDPLRHPLPGAAGPHAPVPHAHPPRTEVLPKEPAADVICGNEAEGTAHRLRTRRGLQRVPVQQRMKCSGMRWSEHGTGLSVLSFRALWKSGRFDPEWRKVMLVLEPETYTFRNRSHHSILESAN